MKQYYRIEKEWNNENADVKIKIVETDENDTIVKQSVYKGEEYEKYAIPIAMLSHDNIDTTKVRFVNTDDESSANKIMQELLSL